VSDAIFPRRRENFCHTPETPSLFYETPQTCSEDVSIWIAPLLHLANDFAAPQPPSAAELKAQESEASLTVQKVIVGAILLYLCTYLPALTCYYFCKQHNLTGYLQPRSQSMSSRSLFRGLSLAGLEDRQNVRVHKPDVYIRMGSSAHTEATAV
jgi:hypothetical protein